MLRRITRTMATVVALSALVMVSQAGAAEKLKVLGTDQLTTVFKVEDTGSLSAAGPLVWDSANKFLGMGISSPVFDIHIKKFSAVVGPIVALHEVGDGFGVKGQFQFVRANGVAGAETAVKSGDFMAQFALQGATGLNTYDNPRRIFQVEASENWSSTNGGFRYAFYTRPNGSVGVPVEALRLDHNGNVGIGTNGTSPTSKLQVVGLPVYADNAAALLGGLNAGAFYRTSAGVVMVVF